MLGFWGHPKEIRHGDCSEKCSIEESGSDEAGSRESAVKKPVKTRVEKLSLVIYGAKTPNECTKVSASILNTVVPASRTLLAGVKRAVTG